MIWLTGASGLLGTDLGKELSARGLPWVGTGHEVDIADVEAVRVFASGHRITWVVNCAAYTAVDKAEDNVEACHRVNADGPAVLARWAAASGAALVHLSTDYVFSGTATEPYSEDDPLAPAGVYGASKAQGESAVRELCERHYILRTAWLYGESGPNFVRTMLRLMGQRDSVGVVADQWGAPTWSRDLAVVIGALLQYEPSAWGTYHTSAEGQCTWHTFAHAILDEARSRGILDPKKTVELNALTTDQYPTKARRPAWSVLSKAKLKKTFGLTFPDWLDSLKAFLATLEGRGQI